MKKLINKYHNKISTLIIMCYISIPLILMCINYHHLDSKYINLWYDLTFIIGCFSGVIGLFNLIFNIKKIRFKNFLPFILITFLLIICFVAAYISTDKKIALEGEWYRHVGYYTYLIFLGFYLNAINVEKRDYKIIGTLLVIVSTIIAIVALMNNEFTHKFFFHTKFPYNAIYMNSNHFGYYLSICVVVSIFLTLYEKNSIKKMIYYLMMAVLFIALIANDTFGAYLGVLVSLLFLIIYSMVKKRNFQLVYIVLLFLVLSLMIGTSNGTIVKNNFNKLFFDVDVIKNSDDDSLVNKTGSDRMKVWKYTYEIVKKNPWFGVGPNIVSKMYADVGINEGVPHNFILEVASYNGIPALIIYLLLLAYVFFRNLFKTNIYNFALLACMISYLVSAFFGNMFFNTSPYFVLIFGMLSSNIILEDKEKVKK